MKKVTKKGKALYETMEKNLQYTSKIVENFGLIKFYKNRIPYNFRSSRFKIEALQKLP